MSFFRYIMDSFDLFSKIPRQPLRRPFLSQKASTSSTSRIKAPSLINQQKIPPSQTPPKTLEHVTVLTNTQSSLDEIIGKISKRNRPPSNTDPSKPLLKTMPWPRPAIFCNKKGRQWAQIVISQYPELLCLLDEDSSQVKRDYSTLKTSYSEELFGSKNSHFDQILTKLHCLQLIVDGSDYAYWQFTKDQPNNLKLSRTSFEMLHLEMQTLITSQLRNMNETETVLALEAFLVLKNIAKSPNVKKLLPHNGATSQQDLCKRFEQALIATPDQYPTYAHLHPAGKQLIIQTEGTDYYEHLACIEGGCSMFSKLKEQIALDPRSTILLFDFLAYACDIAGSQGHINHNSSLVYTEQCHRTMQAVLQSCKLLGTSSTTEVDAYNAYLAIRANWLKFNPEKKKDRVLTRVGAMLHLFDAQEAKILIKAVGQLSSEALIQVIKQLDIIDLKCDPQHLSAVLLNLANNPKLASTKEERMVLALSIGLPFIANILKVYQQYSSFYEINATSALNFRQIVEVAKTNPLVLTKEGSIDLNGNVYIPSA